MKNALAVVALCGLACSAVAQSGRTWVYLADKGFPTPQSEQEAITALPQTYGERATERRRLRRTAPGLFDVRDLPVADGYLERIRATGARVHVESRWLNAVSVEATPEQLGAIRSLSCVTSTVPVRGGRRQTTVEEPVPAFMPRDFYGASSAQLNQINLVALHQAGHTAQGVIIGILDTGFVTSHNAFHQAGHELQIVAARDFVRGDNNVGIEPGDDPNQHMHGTWILGTIAAYLPDTLVGGAYSASFVLCKTEDLPTETPVEEDNYVGGLELCELHGADVTTSSVGYIDWYTQADLDGTTAVTTIGVNIATANGVFCVTAAGNSGHDGDPNSGHLIAPADALEVITCGAGDEAGNIAGFSSDGPTADGRIKPEVLARGVNTITISASDNTGLAGLSGTSLSTPLVATAVACLAGAHPTWSVARMREAIFHTAGDFVAFGQADPLRVRGYGYVNAIAAHGFFECAADFNADGTVDFFDYDDFVNCFERGACPPGSGGADFNDDGSVDFFDYDDFVAAFEAEC